LFVVFAGQAAAADDDDDDVRTAALRCGHGVCVSTTTNHCIVPEMRTLCGLGCTGGAVCGLGLGWRTWRETGASSGLSWRHPLFCSRSPPRTKQGPKTPQTHTSMHTQSLTTTHGEGRVHRTRKYARGAPFLPTSPHCA
jgi:hypothetical protein